MLIVFLRLTLGHFQCLFHSTFRIPTALDLELLGRLLAHQVSDLTLELTLAEAGAMEGNRCLRDRAKRYEFLFMYCMGWALLRSHLLKVSINSPRWSPSHRFRISSPHATYPDFLLVQKRRNLCSIAESDMYFPLHIRRPFSSLVIFSRT